MLFGRKNISRVKRKIRSVCYGIRRKTNLSKFQKIKQDRKIGLDDFFLFKNRIRINGYVVPGDHVKGFLVELCDTTLFYSFEPLPSNDLVEKYGQEALYSRFTFEVPLSNSQQNPDIRLWCVLAGNKIFQVNTEPVLVHNDTPDYNLFNTFLDKVKGMDSGNILEIGSRNRSNLVRKGLIPSHLNYTGMDISSGDNVDIVGDAHKLSTLFPADHFNAVFSVAVFEHLLMPWLVAAEMNTIMKMGAIAFIHSHHAFTLHEEPWDFWRYTDRAWQALFNSYSGFEIIDTQMEFPAYILPRCLSSVTYDMEHGNAFLNSNVMVRKIGTTTLRWQADPQSILTDTYSH